MLRQRLPQLLHDVSGVEPAGAALYTLSDPRELREVRYVGQTRSPRRRLFQHVAAARLDLPGELPWWVVKPELRPLYEWLRELWTDGRRLPAMMVVQWVPTGENVLVAERALILQHLAEGRALLNVEGERRREQLPLL